MVINKERQVIRGNQRLYQVSGDSAEYSYSINLVEGLKTEVCGFSTSFTPINGYYLINPLSYKRRLALQKFVFECPSLSNAPLPLEKIKRQNSMYDI